MNMVVKFVASGIPIQLLHFVRQDSFVGNSGGRVSLNVS